MPFGSLRIAKPLAVIRKTMKLYITIGLLSMSTLIFGQRTSDSTGIEKFNIGLKYYENEQLDSALLTWTEIVEQKIGVKYGVYGSAFLNIPALYWDMKDYENSKKWYQKVLESDLKDSDETGSLSEPHTNYKHKSALALASLNEIDSNYTEVLYWLGLADTVYRYWGFEGSATSISKRQAYLLDWKTSVLIHLDSTNHAIKDIIIELICSDYPSFFASSEEKLIELISDDLFILRFDSALSQADLIQQDKNSWILSYELSELKYQIPIRNKRPDRDLPHYWRVYFITENEIPDKKEIVEDIRNRSFYKRLRN